MLRSSLPFAGSTAGVNFEFGARDGGTFLLARYSNGWTWNEFASNIKQNVNYTMILSVYKNPFRIKATAIDQNGTSLGSYSTSDMTNLAFNNINYLGFGVLESGGSYTVRNIYSTNIPIPSRQWVVDTHGTGDYTSIQAAINSANPRDSIYVKVGTYYEHLTIDKALTLQGENRQTTIIDGGGVDPGSVVIVDANQVTINGFTIQNAKSGGNAIWIDGYNSSTLDNNIIRNNGDGIRFLYTSGNSISNNILTNNPNTALGFDYSYGNTVFNNTFSFNNIAIGASYNVSQILAYSNTIINNSNGILMAVSASRFYHNIIANNTAQAYVYYNLSNQWEMAILLEATIGATNTGVDANHDGIGDTPYVINSNNRDNYPFMNSMMIAPTPSPSPTPTPTP
jgi:parallel beta-helix repeat protein